MIPRTLKKFTRSPSAGWAAAAIKSRQWSHGPRHSSRDGLPLAQAEGEFEAGGERRGAGAAQAEQHIWAPFVTLCHVLRIHADGPKLPLTVRSGFCPRGCLVSAAIGVRSAAGAVEHGLVAMFPILYRAIGVARP